MKKIHVKQAWICIWCNPHRTSMVAIDGKSMAGMVLQTYLECMIKLESLYMNKLISCESAGSLPSSP